MELHVNQLLQAMHVFVPTVIQEIIVKHVNFINKNREIKNKIILNYIVNPCLNNPCLNGAICQTSSTGYLCSCTSGYTGNNCQTGNFQIS